MNLFVTGPGTGELRILNAGSVEVFSKSLPEFTTWDQSFSWNVRDSSGNALPDGTYTLAVKAQGDGSESQIERETAIRIDRTLKIAPRSVWSGSAGLLYAPVAEVLPAGDYQLSFLGAGIAVSNPPVFQAPVQLGARVGLGDSFEVDASAGLIVSSASTPLRRHRLREIQPPDPARLLRDIKRRAREARRSIQCRPSQAAACS